eukprot:4714988-Amphidinium_carterae.1
MLARIELCIAHCSRKTYLIASNGSRSKNRTGKLRCQLSHMSFNSYLNIQSTAQTSAKLASCSHQTTLLHLRVQLQTVFRQQCCEVFRTEAWPRKGLEGKNT